MNRLIHGRSSGQKKERENIGSARLEEILGLVSSTAQGCVLYDGFFRYPPDGLSV